MINLPSPSCFKTKQQNKTKPCCVFTTRGQHRSPVIHLQSSSCCRGARPLKPDQIRHDMKSYEVSWQIQWQTHSVMLHGHTPGQDTRTDFSEKEKGKPVQAAYRSLFQTLYLFIFLLFFYCQLLLYDSLLGGVIIWHFSHNASFSVLNTHWCFSLFFLEYRNKKPSLYLL